jgi:hypothetical protein
VVTVQSTASRCAVPVARSFSRGMEARSDSFAVLVQADRPPWHWQRSGRVFSVGTMPAKLLKVFIPCNNFTCERYESEVTCLLIACCASRRSTLRGALLGPVLDGPALASAAQL